MCGVEKANFALEGEALLQAAHQDSLLTTMDTPGWVCEEA